LGGIFALGTNRTWGAPINEVERERAFRAVWSVRATVVERRRRAWRDVSVMAPSVWSLCCFLKVASSFFPPFSLLFSDFWVSLAHGWVRGSVARVVFMEKLRFCRFRLSGPSAH
jgi:hypothetical protein